MEASQCSAAFAFPLPLTTTYNFFSNSSSLRHHYCRCDHPLRLVSSSSRRRWYASALSEPPKNDDDTNRPGDQDNNKNDPELERQRNELNRILGLELVASKGNGQCACIWCNGTGGRPCTWCRATGVREERITKSWSELQLDIQKKQRGEPVDLPEKRPVQCTACNGFKTLRCRYCRGSGKGSYGFAY